MDLLSAPVVIAPGLGGSGPGHWQSLWAGELPGSERTAPASWSEPDHDDWVAALQRTHDELGGRPSVVVAHSLGCRAAVSWAARHPERIAGLFLVAPPDLPALAGVGVVGFDATDDVRPPVPAVLVTSSDDPYCSLASARRLAEGWGAVLVEAGLLGHINTDSGLGRWPQGFDLLRAFVAGVR